MFNNNYYPYSNYNKIPTLKKLNYKSILDGTQKTLSIINQAIPLIYQIKPLINNAKVAFKIMNTMKSDDNKSKSNEKIKKEEPYNNSPTFFV